LRTVPKSRVPHGRAGRQPPVSPCTSGPAKGRDRGRPRRLSHAPSAPGLGAQIGLDLIERKKLAVLG